MGAEADLLELCRAEPILGEATQVAHVPEWPGPRRTRPCPGEHLARGAREDEVVVPGGDAHVDFVPYMVRGEVAQAWASAH
eukprot:14430387-Alexandrium_andersonii.AAC.1